MDQLQDLFDHLVNLMLILITFALFLSMYILSGESEVLKNTHHEKNKPERRILIFRGAREFFFIQSFPSLFGFI